MKQHENLQLRIQENEEFLDILKRWSQELTTSKSKIDAIIKKYENTTSRYAQLTPLLKGINTPNGYVSQEKYLNNIRLVKDVIICEQALLQNLKFQVP